MLRVIAVIGAGAMGRGIAQLCAQAGFQVMMFDVNTEAAEKALVEICLQWDRLHQKGKLSAHGCSAAKSKLRIVTDLSALASCDLVIEAIIEKLEAKRDLFKQLDDIITDRCILATNTSSLSVTAISATSKLPQRVAGLHFFNPVPLMRVVEIIHGLRTEETVVTRLRNFIAETGHTPVLTKDTPGFIVNHAGRAYVTEALRILQENVAEVKVIDQIMRHVGFKMGPFELMDLTGLDVSHPVMEAIYQQYYQEPRYRPNHIAAQRLQAGLLGRKSGQGFYAYPIEAEAVGDVQIPTIMLPNLDTVSGEMKVWISKANNDAHALLSSLFSRDGVTIDGADVPSEDAICLVTPFGEDVTACVVREGLDARRTIGVDAMFASESSMTMMLNPATDLHLAGQLQSKLLSNNYIVHLIQDSVGFVAQRIVASIVNIACDMCQQGICTPEDLDKAVVLGLAYPHGPLSWGDKLGASRILLVLHNMLEATGESRYRPSPWLVRRVQLDLSLLQRPQSSCNNWHG